MAYTAVNICNLALGKLGGAGDQVEATGQIDSLADTDRVSVWCNTLYPKAILTLITDMAIAKAPIRSTVKMAELDDELTDDDVTISDISVGAAPDYTITVTTDEAHGKTTGDTVVLKGIDGDGNVGELNGTTYTITVIDTTSFTLDETTGSADYDYTEDSGTVSRAPEMGPWTYAFDLPSDCEAVVRVMDELFSTEEETRHEYRFTTVLNKDEDGMIVLTNDLTNADGDGIYIEYVKDTITALDEDADTGLKTKEAEAAATILASFLAPVVGRNTQMAAALWSVYEGKSLNDAMALNQSQIDTTAKVPTDFRGGRNAVISEP
jgi:hypothetical protein